jgi:hypothetical protein
MPSNQEDGFMRQGLQDSSPTSQAKPSLPDQSPVYFTAEPRAFSTGYFCALRAILPSTAAPRSIPEASAR